MKGTSGAHPNGLAAPFGPERCLCKHGKQDENRPPFRMTFREAPMHTGSLFDQLTRLLVGTNQPRQAVNVAYPAFSMISDVGVKRSQNQDRVATAQVGRGVPGSRAFICVAVSDGMGGMIDGERCAIITLSSFITALIVGGTRSAAERLMFAARMANNDVNSFAKGKGGATLSAVLLEENGATWTINVGDSRIYVVPSGREVVERATVDDTLADAFGGQGRELVQFVGIGEALRPNVSELKTSADQVLITSDGAHFFDKHLFDQIVLNAGEPKRAADRLVALSRWLGGPDNATVAAFRPTDLVNSLASDPHTTRVWTPNEVTNFVVLPAPPSGAAPTYNPAHVEAEPTHNRATGRKTGKARLQRKKDPPKEPLVQPELLVTVIQDTSADDVDS